MNEKDLLTGLSQIDEKYIEDARQGKKHYFRKVVLRWISIAAVLCVVYSIFLSVGNMATPVSAEDLMEGITARPVDTVDLKGNSPKVADFALRLMQTANEAGENTLISPVSVLYALAMTANGTEGETLAQMETVLGMPIGELNDWLYSYGQSTNKEQFKLANSIWFTDDERFRVNQEFLQTNADYYGADIYKAPFNDITLRDINNWVKNNTDGMIPKILKEIPDEAVMYLVNALCFDAKWEKKFEPHQIREDKFYLEDRTNVEVDFLYSTEGVYLKDDMATGFVKYYEGKQYAFVAMLPNDHVAVEEYLEYLAGTGVTNLLSTKKNTMVKVSIPIFETEYSAELSDVLKKMGMPRAFEEMDAEFGSLGVYQGENIYIGEVMHKTFITVDEEGTKAAATTSVGMTILTSAPTYKEVYLDRPFVYMIIDVETGVPFFIGTMMDPTK